MGAVLVSGSGHVLAAAHNRTESLADPTAHAEMLCIRAAAGELKAWRLAGCTLYVTLEPCPMCAGAALQARLGGLVYGARNPQLGADGSWVALLPRQRQAKGQGDLGGISSSSSGDGGGGAPRHPFHVDMLVAGGALEADCAAVMRRFFKRRRQGLAHCDAHEGRP